MKQYRTREGDVTAVDTKTALNTVGSETAPGPLTVPGGMKFITGVIVAFSPNHAAATGYSAFIRIEGAGMVNGPESLAVGAGGVPVATGGNSVAPAVRIPVNFPVTEAGEIQLFGEMAGTDIGGMGFVVTLEFNSEAGAGGSENKTLTVEGDLATVDLLTRLTTQGSVTAPSLLVPAGYNRIKSLVLAAASEGLADGKQVWFVRIGGNAVRGGEQVIAVSASGRIAVQSGSDAAPQLCPAQYYADVDIEVTPSDTVSIAMEGAGDDTGTGHGVVTLIFAKGA